MNVRCGVKWFFAPLTHSCPWHGNIARFDTAGAELADDKQLCDELLRKWPHREVRMFILRWMLGDAQSRKNSFGPPQLSLGVYRDLLMLDSLLDEVMTSRANSDRVAV